MAHFEDLTPYRYAHDTQTDVVHAGWLEQGHNFTTGCVPPDLLEKLKELAANPCELYRGYHVCTLCRLPDELRGKPFFEQWERWAQYRKSNGEVRVSRGGITYAAPVLIIHYIEEHGYCPPVEFLKAVAEAPNDESLSLGSDGKH